MTHKKFPYSDEVFRFERKFLISDVPFESVENRIRLHPAAFSEIYAMRQVNNVYFDTLDFKNYFDNVEGRSERLKIRVRWYGVSEEPTAVKPKLELKIKRGSLGRKEQYNLLNFNVGNNSIQEKVDYSLSAATLPSHVKNLMLMHQPTLMNMYERKYYLSRDGLCRATIDKNMRYYRPDPVHKKLNTRHIDDQHTVLELKYDHLDDNDRAHAIANTLPFRVTKNSKYVTGIEALYDI